MGDFFNFCEEMGDKVEEAIRDLVDTPAGWESVSMGADGTPTRRLDRVAEDCILESLVAERPYKTLISEEVGRFEIGGEKGTLFLDPVDGTYNAAHGIPFYALSIALAEEGVVKKGYVRDLGHADTFTASRGEGAFLNGRPIRVSSIRSLEESAMSIYGKKFDPGHLLHLGQKIRRWRQLGASALELAYVGSGRIDGFIDLRRTLRVTDAAAGMLICEEAGGSVSDLEGRPLVFPDEVTIGRPLIATNGHLQAKVIEYLR
ncbi:MAG: bifunctional fructose-bisphosphatase/inositol-phosphate phosphatase [Methanomicrobiales archaeon]|nr:bifunctional fructose-bisphosphatase/inositol-phosphate phosphatase [Methanomicrobiales archaeon]